MYIPPYAKMTDLHEQHALMRAYNFAIIITPGKEGVLVSHLPFFLDADEGDQGTLYAHFAQANGHWLGLTDGVESCVIFSGPHAYVSPQWYSEPSARVPTWNYVAVHAYGHAKPLTAGMESEVAMERLVAAHEGPEGWSIEQLEEAQRARVLAGVVPFKIEIERIEGKHKLDQNKPAADRLKAADALAAQGHSELAQRMRAV